MEGKHNLEVAMCPPPRFPSGVSLLHQIPPELLSRIFLHCLPTNLADYTPSELPFFPNRHFLYLCEVDGHTREVATRTPELWTFIRIIIPEYEPLSSTPYLALPIWLTRSGVLPLHLELHQKKMYAEDVKSTSLRAARIVFEEFSKVFWHCDYLRLDVASRTLTRPIVITSPEIGNAGPVTGTTITSSPPNLAAIVYPEVQQTSTFMLEKLHVNFIDTESFISFNPTHIASIMTFNLFAPRLHSVSGSFILDSENWRTSLPWEQLTELDIRMNNVSSCVEVLGLCPNLLRYRLNLDSAGRFVSSLGSLKPLEHPSLSAFHVICPAYDLELIFAKLSLPYLVDLEVQKNNWNYGLLNWPHQEFMGLLKRSGCHLERLRLMYTEIDVDELKQLARDESMYNLRDFGMGEAWEWPSTRKEALLELLTIVPASKEHTQMEVALRSLDSLTVAGPASPDFVTCQDGVLAQMVQSRWREDQDEDAQAESGSFRKEVARLNRLIIEVPNSHIQDRAILTMLSQQGLQITFL